MFYRNRLLFGVIRTVVTTVWQVLYGVICFLNLQPVLIVILLWVLLHFTGVTEKYTIATVLLCLAFVLAVIYAVLTCLKQLLGLDKKKQKERRGAENVKKVKPKEEENKDNKADTDTYKEIKNGTAERNSLSDQDKPRYYRVKQNSSLIMAEYSDRYELYKVLDGKLLKIRTDYKG